MVDGVRAGGERARVGGRGGIALAGALAGLAFERGGDLVAAGIRLAGGDRLRGGDGGRPVGDGQHRFGDPPEVGGRDARDNLRSQQAGEEGGGLEVGSTLLQDVGELELDLALELGGRMGGQRLAEETLGVPRVIGVLGRHAAPVGGLDALGRLGEAGEQLAERAVGSTVLLGADLLHRARIQGFGGERRFRIAGEKVRPVAPRLLGTVRLDLLDAGLEEGLGGYRARGPLLGKAAIRAGGAQAVSRALLEPGEAVVCRGGERTVMLVRHAPGELDGEGEVRLGDGGLVAEAPGTVFGRLRGIRTALQLGQDVGVLAHAGEEGEAVEPFRVCVAAGGELRERVVVRGLRVAAALKRLERRGGEVPGVLDVRVAQG